ncbi:hypothetical protein [Pseudomonas sp. UME65]|uniref:hypothetical protein n=1 Tax=Pseudomonas sp. UME65 TaxID=1862317 RepID=UPI0011A7F307|nr:hypothetical protein [Pseudomonas sp. UME65]
MTDVSPGKPSADEPVLQDGCTLAANPMQQDEQGATNLRRISCTLSKNWSLTTLLLLFGAKNGVFRSKGTSRRQATPCRNFIPDKLLLFPAKNGLHPVAPIAVRG